MTHPAEQNIASVANALDDPAAQGLTRGQRLGRLVSSWIGSLPSVGVHVILLGAWIGTNRGMSASSPSFDPFPYSGLATILAIEMLILTLFILMNQAAMARQTERRGHLDLQLNLLAEQESTINLAILRRLCEHLRIDIRDIAAGHNLATLAEKTNVEELMGAVDTHL